MTHTSLRDAALALLSFPERVELAQDLWDSVHEHASAAPLTADQLAELDRRMLEIDEGKVVCEPWEEVRKRLLAERR